jgi:hypothetical protein
MRREAGWGEKFFYCQTSRLRVRATRISAGPIRRSDVEDLSIVESQLAETSVAQSFLGISTPGGCGLSRVFCVAARRDRCVIDERAVIALALPRQHLLKRDAVFFDVLVYSGCSAFRFPGARSE